MKKQMREKNRDTRKFGKNQLLISRQFSPVQKNVLMYLLQENQQYSIEDAAAALEKYLQQEVK